MVNRSPDLVTGRSSQLPVHEETVSPRGIVVLYCDLLQGDADIVDFRYNIDPEVVRWPNNQLPPIIRCNPNTEQLQTELLTHTADHVIVILPGKNVNNLESIVKQCIDSGATVIVLTGNPRDYASSVNQSANCQIVDKGNGPQALRVALQSAIDQLQQAPSTPAPLAKILIQI